MSCYYDYDPPEFVSTDTRTARKQHKCCECGHEIKPGEKYEHVAGKWDGRLGTFDTCEKCVDLRDSLAAQNGCFTYGRLNEDYWYFLETTLPGGVAVRHAEVLAKHRIVGHRLERAMMKHRTWKVFDALLTAGMVGSALHWGNGWLAAAVFAFGLWNYFDGLVRARW